ncbi:hypothetical protein VP01_2719g1, partial [Puccinia sorghi]
QLAASSSGIKGEHGAQSTPRGSKIPSSEQMNPLSTMPWNSAPSLLHNKLLAWCCCIYTSRIVRAHPYLQDMVKGHELTPGLHSSAEDIHAPLLQHAGFNPEGFINHKRSRGSPPAAHHQPGFSNSNPDWLGWNVDHDYPNANPGNGVMSKATKRPKMVQNGQFTTPAPQSNYGFDTAFATGATNEDTFRPVGIKETQNHQASDHSNQLLSSPSTSVSLASLNPNRVTLESMFQSIPTHGFQRPQEDSRVFQLFKEFPSSEFQRFDDLQWLSSLNHVEPASSSPLHEQKLVPGHKAP